MISYVMQTNKCAPRGNHVLNAQSLKRDGRASLHRRVPHQSHRRIPTTLTSGHKAPVLLRPCATRNRTVAHNAQWFYRPSSGHRPVESLTNSVYLTPSRSRSKARRCMASDKPCWTEPPGRRWNGQCKFQRGVSAMPMLAAPGCAVAMRSHTGHQGGVWPMRQPCRVARFTDVAWPTQEAPGLCEEADGEHTVVPRAHLTAGLDMQPSGALQWPRDQRCGAPPRTTARARNAHSTPRRWPPRGA